MKQVNIEKSWKDVLSEEFEKQYWQELTSFVKAEYQKSEIYPHPKNIFRAFDLCPLEKVKVVIVGQDPYHGEKQAIGLSFAVNDGITLPPSLKNIYKEIKNDLGITPNQSGDLSRWASQGVLLLNSVLTVKKDLPASHKGKGWEIFTDVVIKTLSNKKTQVVYFLWGNYAKTKGEMVDKTKNLVLTSGHPSPFSANLFFGNKHFSKCNEYLVKNGMTPINWS